jgi:hypothetical protein
VATTEAQIKITADTGPAQREIKSLENALKGLQDASGAAAATLAKITAAAAAVGYAIGRTIQSVGALNDMSKALGMSAQNLQYLQQSAQLAGIGADELNASLIRLQNNIGTALVQQSGPGFEAIKRMGIGFDELKNKSPEEQFRLITQRISAIEDPAVRAALATDLLGKQGPRLLKAAEAMDALKRRTEELGFALSDLDVEMIDQAGDKFDEVKFIIQAGVQKAVAALAPYLIAMAEYIESAVISIRNNADTWIMVAKALGIVIGALITYRAYMVMTAIIQSVMAVAMGFIKMYQAIKVATTAMEVLNAVMGKNPIIKILSAVVAIGAMFAATKAAGSAFSELDAKAQQVSEDIANGMNSSSNETEKFSTKVDMTAKKIEAANEALKKFLAGVKNDIQYQTDVLSVGEKQASINKIINEEKAKLIEAGGKMLPAQEASLRRDLEKIQALKDQNAVLSAQKNLLEGFLNAQTGGEKLLTDIQNIKRIAAGQEIVLPIKLETPEDIAANVGPALSAAEKQVGAFVDNTVAQYSKLYGEAFQITNDYNKAVREIDTAMELAREAGGARELERITALEEAKIAVEQNAYRRRLEMELNLFNERNKIRDMERQRDANRVAESLQNERDIFGGRMFSSQQIDDIAKKTAENKKAYEENAAKFVIKQGADAFAALGTQNKKAFEAYKAFKIAQTIMDTISGARAAFASLAPIPFVGVPLGIAAAAAAIAAGMAQVAQIRSLTYSGRAKGGPVAGGMPYLVGEQGPEIFRPTTGGNIIPNNQLGNNSPVNVNFTIVANDTQGFDQLLTSRKGVIQQIISDAMLERGQRSMV